MRVLIAAGGTAGHINPALAIAGALKAADPTVEIHFAGRREGMEYGLVTKAGYPFHHIEINGFQRKINLENIGRNIVAVWHLALSGPRTKNSICKESVETIGKTLRELESAGYLTRRQLRGKNGRITDTEYTIFEKPVKPQPEPAPPDTASPGTENPDMVNPDMETPDMAVPDTENPPQLNTKKSNIQKSNTHGSNTHSFFPSAPAAAETDGQTEVMEKREEIRDQIEYEHICNSLNREQIDEFVEIMLEVALTKSPTIKIGRDAEYPTAFVQQRFAKITCSHIEKVLDGIHENTTRVWNTKAYLMAALFNAPSSLDNHYTMLVNHDLYGGGS